MNSIKVGGLGLALLLGCGGCAAKVDIDSLPAEVRSLKGVEFLIKADANDDGRISDKELFAALYTKYRGVDANGNIPINDFLNTIFSQAELDGVARLVDKDRRHLPTLAHDCWLGLKRLGFDDSKYRIYTGNH